MVASGEVALDRLRGDPALWLDFLAVQQPWIDAGVTRWLDLVRADGPWPCFVVAAWRPEQPDHLLGTVIGIWAAQPVSRFDDLLEHACPGGWRGVDRPAGGVWHFIAATAGKDADGLGLGRQLVGFALAWMDQFAPDALARTLSPAVGLPELLALTGGDVARAVHGLVTQGGQPALPILRLHLGAGATLDAILEDSRRDEVRSGRVTLRFAYDRDANRRAAQRQQYREQVATRADTIAAGGLSRVSDADYWTEG